MKWFKNCESLEDVKKRYRELALKHHPDQGGSEEVMKEINLQHKEVINNINANTTKEQRDINISETMREVLEEISHIQDITIEIVGSWIWIDGNTYQIKEKLKELNMKWSSGRKKWYWKSGDSKKRKGSGKSWDKIKKKYGHAKIKDKEEDNIKKIAS